MRTIRFRGKRLYDNKFVYGSLVQCLSGSVGIFNGDDFQHNSITAIKKSTIGQFTGLTDKNGKAIYEGDIVQWGDTEHKIKQVVEFRNGAFGYVYDTIGSFVPYAANTNFDFAALGTDKRFEVIGNIHDNPELLGEKGGEQ